MNVIVEPAKPDIIINGTMHSLPDMAGADGVLVQLIPILVPLFFFAALVAIVVIPMVINARKQREAQVTIRHAIDKGVQLPPEFLSALAPKEFRTPAQDLRRGLILLAVGIGISLFAMGVSVEDRDAVWPLVGIAAIPALIGLAHVILWRLNRKSDTLEQE